MLIEPHKLQHWADNFYGYGSWNARNWFVAYEEGGGDLPEEVAEKFNYFYRVHPPTPDAFEKLCDVRALYREVGFRVEGPRGETFDTLYDYRFGPKANNHGIWKNLIAFVYGFRNEDAPDLLTYQQHSFAVPSIGSEALIPLYPLPSTHNHAWYYSWLDMPEFPFLKSRSLYEGHMYESRTHRILDKLRTCKPDVVVMYGMNNINVLKKSVKEFFPKAKFKMVKAVKLQIPQHHIADLDGTTLVITTQVPALRHNRVETGFDWLEFGKLVRSENV